MTRKANTPALADDEEVHVYEGESDEAPLTSLGAIISVAPAPPNIWAWFDDHGVFEAEQVELVGVTRTGRLVNINVCEGRWQVVESVSNFVEITVGKERPTTKTSAT